MEENIPSEDLNSETPVLSETPEIIHKTPVVEQKKKPWVKIIILLIVILLGCAGLVFVGMEIQKRQTSTQSAPTSEPVATPTPDPTADWKTYTNNLYSYQFKFPQNWELDRRYGGPRELSDKQLAELEFVSIFNSQATDNGDVVSFTAEDGQPDPKSSVVKITPIICTEISSFSCLKQIFTGDSVPQFTEVSVASSPAIRVENLVPLSSGIFSTDIYILYKEKILNIRLSVGNENRRKQTTEIFDQILSTFKFLDEAEKVDISNWKTYRSTSLGFEIKYPSALAINNELNDQYNQGVELKGNGLDVWVSRRSAEGLDFNNYNYMDNPVKTKTTLAGETAYVYEFTKGACDGPSCSSPSTAYVVKKDLNLYILSFSGDAKLGEVGKGMLSTFKFVSLTR